MDRSHRHWQDKADNAFAWDWDHHGNWFPKRELRALPLQELESSIRQHAQSPSRSQHRRNTKSVPQGTKRRLRTMIAAVFTQAQSPFAASNSAPCNDTLPYRRNADQEEAHCQWVQRLVLHSLGSHHNAAPADPRCAASVQILVAASESRLLPSKIHERFEHTTRYEQEPCQ